jgi:hypothetical protein
MHGENLRKYTETRVQAPRALCIDFASAKNTVQSHASSYDKQSGGVFGALTKTSPNNAVFSVPPIASIALCGSLVLPYTLVV